MTDKTIIFECPECGLHYDNDEVVKECAAWCRKYKSCSLEITKKSIERQTPPVQL